MTDENAGPPPLPETPAPLSGASPPAVETPPLGPIPSSGVALGIVALIGGLLLLIPGGLCSVMAVGMCAGGGEEGQIAWVVGGIGLPALAVGIGLLIFGARRLRRRRAG